jgi:hypothetical protein
MAETQEVTGFEEAKANAEADHAEAWLDIIRRIERKAQVTAERNTYGR